MATTTDDQTPENSVSNSGDCSSACAYDSNGDGDCHWCANRGGCAAIGGPFEVKPITPSIEHLQQLGILPKPFDDGFEFVK